MLIEIARKRGNYVPDLSFGTHFFQDLVEASIRYLPLYPDDPGVAFNERFLRSSHNILSDIAPEYAFLSDVVRVVDVQKAADNRVLRVLMNAELDEAVGLLVRSSGNATLNGEVRPPQAQAPNEDHWRWRMQMAEKIAQYLDPDRFGVKALYVFGSAKNASAGPGSDLDLLIHFEGSDEQRKALMEWLEGWSLCLGEMNYLRTGYKPQSLLDIHIVTDRDIAARDPFASKIGAVTDAARPLPLPMRDKAAVVHHVRKTRE
jgi:predicted nucleotidyltransferase